MVYIICFLISSLFFLAVRKAKKEYCVFCKHRHFYSLFFGGYKELIVSGRM